MINVPVDTFVEERHYYWLHHLANIPPNITRHGLKLIAPTTKAGLIDLCRMLNI